MDSEQLIRISLYICAALALIFFAEAIYGAVIVPISRRRSINRRLRTLDEGVAGEQALLRIKAERGILDRDVAIMGSLSQLLVHSGLRLTPIRFMLICALCIAGISIAFSIFTSMPNILCWLAGLPLGILIPLQVVRFIASRRKLAFVNQLPDALDVVVRSLRAGHPVPTAMGLVAREMADPAGTEFGITVDEMTYGLGMPKALSNLSDRVGVPDLALLVTAVSLQSGSGGNLSEVLENLSKVLRSRFQLRRKVRSISAEGRFSAYGLTILPVVIFLAIYVQNPRYYSDVWLDPKFQMAMAGLVVWMVIGNFMMYKMINFKF